MIIQLLGANGAGKSTIVQEIMGLRPRVPLHLWGRRVPDACALDDVVIAGHYEGSACGGGDTLPRDRVTDTLRNLHATVGKPILIEGPTGREPMLVPPLVVLYLKKPVAACLGNWINRNQAKGLKVNVLGMERRVRACITRIERMIDAYREEGVEVTIFNKRPECAAHIEHLLGRK